MHEMKKFVASLRHQINGLTVLPRRGCLFLPEAGRGRTHAPLNLLCSEHRPTRTNKCLVGNKTAILFRTRRRAMHAALH
jgi:hypothetical protein